MNIPIQSIDRSQEVRALAPPPDGLLLERFIQEGNQDAFAALMQRHGPYVLSVCRHMTRHAQDAEDVFQACFLELIRNASSIRQRGSVAGWLQTVAVRLARKSQARTARQRQKESVATNKEAVVTLDDISWREACQILQEEIAELPEELRLPIILCLFQGHTQEETAQDLGINPRTVKDRLRRGRDLLRDRLVKRGVTLAVLGTLLSAGSAQAAVPAALAQGTLQGAAALTTKAAIAAAPLSFAGIGFTSWVAIAVAVLGVTLTGSGAFILWEHAEPAAVPAPALPPAPKRVAAPPAPGKVHRSFRGKQFDDRFFQWSGPNAQKYARLEDEGLRITLPAENGPADAIGVKLKHRVRGDMEAEATLEFLNVPSHREGWSSVVSLYFFMESTDRDGFWHGKMNDSMRGPTYSFGHRIGKHQERVTKFLEFRPAEHEVGFARLKVVRKGAQFDLYAAEGLAADFKHLHTVKVSAASITIVRFAADPIWRPDVPIDVRLVDFTIKAEELVGYE